MGLSAREMMDGYVPWGGGGEERSGIAGIAGIELLYRTVLGNGFVYIPPRPFLLGLFAVIFSRFFFLGQRQRQRQRQLHTRPDQTSIPDYILRYQLIISNTNFQQPPTYISQPARSPLSSKRTTTHYLHLRPFITHRLLTNFGHIHHHHISHPIQTAPTRLQPPTHTAHKKKPRNYQTSRPLTAATPSFVCSRPHSRQQTATHTASETRHR